MKKKLNAIIGILILGVAVYLVYKLFPPYFNNFRFEDDVKNMAMAESYTNHSETEIRDRVIRTGNEYDIPLTPQNIRVTRNFGSVTISVDYTVNIDIPVHPFDLHFHSTSANTAL